MNLENINLLHEEGKTCPIIKAPCTVNCLAFKTLISRVPMHSDKKSKEVKTLATKRNWLQKLLGFKDQYDVSTEYSRYITHTMKIHRQSCKYIPKERVFKVINPIPEPFWTRWHRLYGFSRSMTALEENPKPHVYRIEDGELVDYYTE